MNKLLSLLVAPAVFVLALGTAPSQAQVAPERLEEIIQEVRAACSSAIECEARIAEITLEIRRGVQDAATANIQLLTVLDTMLGVSEAAIESGSPLPGNVRSSLSNAIGSLSNAFLPEPGAEDPSAVAQERARIVREMATQVASGRSVASVDRAPLTPATAS